MTKQILEQLFESPVKVKLLKLFLRNPDQSFSVGEAAKRTRVDHRAVRSRVENLRKIGFLKRRIAQKKQVFSINPEFDFYEELRSLVLKSSPASKEKMQRKIKRLGKIKLALLSGVFINKEATRADLLIVGDNISRKRLRNFLRNLEAEVGKEIDYVAMTTEEFNYRRDMFDRFIRDVLDGPHEKLINRMRI